MTADFTIAEFIVCIAVSLATYYVSSLMEIGSKYKESNNHFKFKGALVIFIFAIFMAGGFPDVVYVSLAHVIKALQIKLW